MDLNLSEEQRMIRDMARDFADREVSPGAAERDRTGHFPQELVRRMGDLGLMGIAVPSEWGGSGIDNVSYILALEEVSRACASTGVIMSVNNSLVCDPLLANGSEAQKRDFLTPLASGKWLGCFALTEAGAGSDVAAMNSSASLEGEKWVLNGTKRFITNAPDADLCIYFAYTDRELKHRGISAFLIEKGTPGYSIPRKEEKLGISAASSAEVVLENCRIPKEDLLGERGRGFKIAMETLDGGRIGIAAQAVGIGRAALEASIAYARERVQFGRPIAELQAIQWMIADMATEIDAARLLAYRAALLKDEGKPHNREAAMAKLFASEAAMRAATKGVQIHGGYGYIKEYPVERYFRDAKITEIYEGTSEIQRLVIAASLLR